MRLPGQEWLRSCLKATQHAGGGNQRNMGSPVQSGATFTMTLLFVALWMVALTPMMLWAAIGRTRQAR